MAEYKAEFIQVPTHNSGGFQTMAVEPQRRIKSDNIVVQLCDAETDSEKIAESLYAAFPEQWWARIEPPTLRPAEQSTRQSRIAKRLRASFIFPDMDRVKAVYAPTGETVGVAGWTGPGSTATNIFAKSALVNDGWQGKMGWSDEEIEEMFCGGDIEAFDGQSNKSEGIRKALMGEEPHWFFAELATWPEFQGRGVGTKLMEWATKQADANDPPTPMYLESASTARAVYMRFGFKQQGEHNFLRKGAAIVGGLEVEEEKDEELRMEHQVV